MRIRLQLLVALLAIPLVLTGCDWINKLLGLQNPPTVQATAPATGVVGTEIVLDGSGSQDKDGDTLTYSWALLYAPSASALVTKDLKNSTASIASFVADYPGTYKIELKVSDGSSEVKATVTIEIAWDSSGSPPSEPSGPSVGTTTTSVTLSWTAAGDALMYEVYRDTSATGLFTTRIYKGTDPGFVDTGLKTSTTYYYKIVAKNNSGITATATPVSATTDGAKPGTPAGLTVGSATGTTLTVRWQTVTLANSYEVFRDSSDTGTFASSVYAGTATSFTDSGLTNGTTYWYKVQAANGKGPSDLSVAVSGTTTTPPAVPTMLFVDPALATGASLTISWNSAIGASGYEVYRDSTEGGAFTSKAYDGTSLSFVNSSLTQGTTYWYKVLAKGSGGKSSLSSAVSGTTLGVPAVPTGLAVGGATVSGLKISWTAVNGATLYRLYRDSNSTNPIMETDQTSYADSGLTANTTYAYRVSAGNSVGVSALSAAVSGTTLAEIAGAPTGVSATDGTDTAKVVVSWNVVSGATSYNVYRCATSDGTYTLLGSVNAPLVSYADQAPGMGVDWYYKVTAVTGAVESSQSPCDSGYQGVATPTGVSATDGTSSSLITVSWTDVGAGSYMVNRSTVENGTYTLLSDVTGTGFDDATATPGIDYYYKVRAAAGSYSSAWSTADAGWQALLAPTNCTASDGVIGKVTISWNTVDGATGYEVRRADSSGGSGTLLASPASSPYDDATAAPAVAYYYVVRAVSAGHTGPDSKEDSGYQGLDIPQGVTASKAEFTDKIVVTWSSAVAGATSYEVRRADSDSGPFTMIGTSTTLSYTDTTVAPGAMYYYEVFAFANGYYSAPSTYDVGVLRLAAPSGVAATDGTSTASIGVSWNAVDGAASYNVFRADSSLGPFNPVGTSTEVTFADSKAAAHVTYYYKASAFANGYAGDLSADPADSGWRRLPGPTGVVASDGTSTTSVTVSWAAVTGATSYNVYRGPASSGTDFTLLGSSTGTSTSYPDSTGTDDSAHPYYYKASAVVNGYESELSADPADSGYRKISSALGVSASDGTSATSISVSWKTLASATSYNVYRGPASSGLFTSIGSVTAPALSYADTTAGSHIYYYYKVSAIVSGNETDISADLADSGWRALPAPTGIGATTNNVSQVNVTWTAVSGADGYAVRRSADGGTSWTQIGTTTASPFADMNVPTPGVTYYYDVAATTLNSLVGLRGAKAGGYRAMATPTGLTASAGTYNYVRLSWTAVTGAASYQVYRAGTLIAQPTAAAYSDTPADPHLDYSYTVQSVGANGAVSGQSTAATGWYSLSALKSVTASMDTYVDHIRVTWTSVTNAQSYNLYRSTDQKTWTSVATGLAANGTYDDYTATRLTTWYYAVRAVRYSREGLWSNMPTGHDGSLTVGATTHYNLQDANDYIGGYNGYVYGGAKLVADRFARAGGAFEFNGTTATIYKIRPELANAAFTGGAATISIWLKSPLKVGVPDVCIFSCQAFRVYEYKGALYFQWLDAKLQRLSTAAVAITTDWTHFVVTFDGSHLLTYLNGTNKGTTTLPYPLKLDTTAVGMAAFAAIPDVNKLYWPGVIDALTIYNRVLAPEEIAALNKADENSLFK